mgnify:CR=1 FL=1
MPNYYVTVTKTARILVLGADDENEASDFASDTFDQDCQIHTEWEMREVADAELEEIKILADGVSKP